MIDLSDFATSPIILKSSFAMFKPGEGKLKILLVSKWVKTISKGRLDSIPSPSPSVKIQIMGRNIFPYYLKQTFPPILWIFTEGEDAGIESRLSS